MTLKVKNKNNNSISTAIPGFINLFNNGKLIIENKGVEFLDNILYYEVYIPYSEKWIDLNYALSEGFLEPKELRQWPGK